MFKSYSLTKVWIDNRKSLFFNCGIKADKKQNPK